MIIGYLFCLKKLCKANKPSHFINSFSISCTVLCAIGMIGFKNE